MSEQPAYTITETPVLDPNLFLLNRVNRAFVQRRNDKPHFLMREPELSKRQVIDFFVILLWFSACAGAVLGFPSGTGAFVLGMIVLLTIAYGAGLKPTTFPGNKSELVGWILPGVVLHSEKVRVEREQSWREHLGIRFEFTTPEEIVTEAYAEGESNKASDKMAPFPGTPVRVWYGDDGKVFLL
jgi:hypothetical protein